MFGSYRQREDIDMLERNEKQPRPGDMGWRKDPIPDSYWIDGKEVTKAEWDSYFKKEGK